MVGAAAVAKASGYPDILAFDVGGTSTDVSLVLGGRPLFTSERTVAGHPVKSPAVDDRDWRRRRQHCVDRWRGRPQGRSAERGCRPDRRIRARRRGRDTDRCQHRTRPPQPGALLAGRMKMDADAARRAIEEAVAKPPGFRRRCCHRYHPRCRLWFARAIRSVASAKGHNPAYSRSSLTAARDLCLQATSTTKLDANEYWCLASPARSAPEAFCYRPDLDFVKTLLCRAEEDGWRQAKAAFDELEHKLKYACCRRCSRGGSRISPLCRSTL